MSMENRTFVENRNISSAISYLDYIKFLYNVLFDRDPESAAIKHWSDYLSKGLTLRELFEALWNSEEFASKVNQNRYFKASRTVQELEMKEGKIVSDDFFAALIETLRQDPDRLLEISS